MGRKLENKRRRSLDDNDDDEWEAHISRRVDLTRPKSVTTAHGPASRTRSSKKIKLDEVASIQGGEVSRLEDHRAHIGDLRSNFASKSRIPEKRVLELILDILQRRDTHEIFGEPVDPEEVEDYYEIIKEPMDFGTMRAKLHEGLYKSLEQFEKDIFLITRNAMHFNSSGTIYFRQARVLNELATEVFRVLRNRPESFQSEFSDSRRRNARRSLVDSRNSLQRARAKVARNVKPSNGIVIDESSKSMPCSVGSYLNIRQPNPSKQPGYFAPTVCSNARDHKVPFSGRGDDTRLIPTEAERRYTYRPWLSSFDEDKSISNRKQLEHVIQKDISYSKSLMLFVRDLGPVVQSFARNKLSKSFPISVINHYDFHDSPITGPKSHNFIDHILRTSATKRTVFEDSFKSESILINAPSIKREISSVSIGDQNPQDQSGEILSASSLLARAADLSTVRVGVKSVGNSSATVADRGSEIGFWHHHCNSSEPKSRKVHEFLYLREDDQFKVEATMAVDCCKPSSSNFVFEFPSIESRLGQTNAFERLALLHRSLGSEVNFYSAVE